MKIVDVNAGIHSIAASAGADQPTRRHGEQMHTSLVHLELTDSRPQLLHSCDLACVLCCAPTRA